MDLAIFGAIVGPIAILISVGHVYVEFRRARRPLVIRCTYIETHAEHAQSRCLAVLRIGLINEASVGRTVCSLRSRTIEGYSISIAPPKYDYKKAAVFFLPDEKATEGVQFRPDEVFLLPLDIPPRSSEGRWIGLVISPVPPLTSDSFLQLGLTAYDVNDKPMATTEILLIPTLPGFSSVR